MQNQIHAHSCFEWTDMDPAPLKCSARGLFSLRSAQVFQGDVGVAWSERSRVTQVESAAGTRPR
ncbi:hypothetical protein EYF80_018778 [Liparis tanakae]|uniref:Uncharacterized protein n=1 Tax=Liparis tanakae TaxID=230148 RepID=A0A4Z2I148_9TELE|nr:hypothetical protein EYF80_018778 [Liparis tanakae]